MPTRWNATCAMLDFVTSNYQPAVEALIADRSNNLRKWELDEEEWAIAKQLKNLLQVCTFYILCSQFNRSFLTLLLGLAQVFQHATLQFSKRTASLSSVIPEMDDVDESLASAASKETVHPAIRAAAAVGSKTLNKYYSLSDRSECYRIAMGMYPFCLFNIFYQLISCQSSTLNTSSSISGTLSGLMNGFRTRIC